MRPIVRRVLAAFPDPPAGLDEAALLAFLVRDVEVRELPQQARRLFLVEPRMTGSFDVPVLTTTAAVAEWLGISPGELDWFAACPGRTRRLPADRSHHYTHCWLEKRTGGKRLVEAPRGRLKAIQRRALHDILDRVPAHPAAHGFCRGRSILSYASPHTGQSFVMRFDLRDFFASVRASRVHAVFRRIGYPRDVARVLTRLCTTVTPLCVEDAGSPGFDWTPYRQAHLPQGAPTSPALANLCAYRLDCRLTGLAQKLGARYTRYADDLALSGGEALERSGRRVHVLVCRIALEEGFEVNTRKTRFMRQGVRQRLAGVVVNVRPNVARADYDLLKAILHNCVRHGPGGQNRDAVPDFRAHLLGRIAHVASIHPRQGELLQELFERIKWDKPSGPAMS